MFVRKDVRSLNQYVMLRGGEGNGFCYEVLWKLWGGGGGGVSSDTVV